MNDTTSKPKTAAVIAGDFTTHELRDIHTDLREIGYAPKIFDTIANMTGTPSMIVSNNDGHRESHGAITAEELAVQARNTPPAHKK